MPVEIDDNGWNPKEDAAKLENTLRSQFGQVMADALAEMIIRIRSGRDVNNTQMHGYTDAYKKRKADAGRSVSPPDMTFTGLMLNSIQTRIIPRGQSTLEGLIYFANPVAADRARGNIDNGRDFYGLTTEQQNAMYERLEALINI